MGILDLYVVLSSSWGRILTAQTLDGRLSDWETKVVLDLQEPSLIVRYLSIHTSYIQGLQSSLWSEIRFYTALSTVISSAFLATHSLVSEWDHAYEYILFWGGVGLLGVAISALVVASIRHSFYVPGHPRDIIAEMSKVEQSYKKPSANQEVKVLIESCLLAIVQLDRGSRFRQRCLFFVRLASLGSVISLAVLVSNT